jgi:DNA-3-methyladenine glycosylase II
MDPLSYAPLVGLACYAFPMIEWRRPIMFSLARADAWSPGDLALQHAVKEALLLAERPSLVQMNEVAEAWRPWRGVAARLLWSYYALRRRSSPSPVGEGPP